MKAVSLVLLLVLGCSVAQAQTTIIGQVTDKAAEPLPGVTVRLGGTFIGTVTDIQGRYELTNVSAGSYSLEASAVNYQKRRIEITVMPEAPLSVDFVLAERVSALEEVVVKGATEAQALSSQPITITSLDARALSNQAIGVIEVLQRSTGVLVRRSGGLGSDAQINLNGLAGNAVRLYYDGIPLEYLGGIEINNLPVNLIDRVDVYKGVMPINVGTDALGGGINIVPRQTLGNYREASYELGSFNTHRLSAMGLHRWESGFFVGLNAFFNYSDNDYLMRDVPNQTVDIFENRFGRTDTAVVASRTDARRFNDQHISTYAEAQVGVTQKTWADRLMFSTAFSYRYDEIQHGPRIIARPGAETNREQRTFIQRIRYQHTLKNGAEIDYSGILSLTRDAVDDSTRYLYDWNGNVLPINNNRGSEILSRPSGRVGNTLSTTHRGSVRYQFHDRFTLGVSDFFSYSRIEGRDPYGIRLPIGDAQVDLNTVPATFRKNILGAELSSTWLKDALSTILFYKNYHYRAESIDITQERGDRLPTRSNQHQDHGYGLALKYTPRPNLFFRTSYEQALRIPNESEIYGNFLTIRPNYNIKPERSHNVNLGGFAQHHWGKAQSVSVDVNGFLRNQQDLIRLEVSGGGEVAQYINEREVRAIGVETSVKARPLASLYLSTNLTFQQVTLSASDQLQNNSFVGVQIPNIPDLFWNSAAQYTLSSLFREEDAVEVFWNYFFVDRFSVTYVLDESRANPDNLVPAQHQHNVGCSYAPSPQGLRFTFQVNNITNAQVFDNFRIPKPGRNFSFKINYFI